MPPRVTYWTGTWAPEREAISKEIESLRGSGRSRAPVVAFSSGQRSRLHARDGVIQLSVRRWMALRGAAALVERMGDVSHVFGGLESWHLLRALGRRPMLLTAVVHGEAADASMHSKVSRFVAETPLLARELVASGIPSEAIDTIYPGIDLDLFVPRPFPATRFRVLFASSPADPSEFGARGIPLLVEAARRCPDVEFVFLWRQWGSRAGADEAMRELRPPTNVTFVRRDIPDMPAAYNHAHVVACLYAPRFGKSAPNSILEGLACGRPALVSEAGGIADLVRESGAGVCVAADPDSVAAGISRLRENLATYAASARGTAERVLDLRAFRRQYAALYDQLGSHASNSSRRVYSPQANTDECR